ncbi:MAG: hypothetical protein V4592_24100 [Bacteroidota bacterium]
MKKLIFTLLVCVSAFAANAQVGYNYAQYDFGFSAGFNTTHTDFTNSKPGYAAHAHFTYNFTPYINYIAELQVGTLRGDSLSAIIPGSHYNFNNNYSAVSFRAQLQMGEILDYSQSRFFNALKNFYISGGVGVIYTDLQVYDSGALSVESKGSNVFIPLKVGYEFKFFNDYNEPRLKFDIGYQHNLIMTDNFDGINYGSNQDAFSQIVIGLKFAIGGTTSYRKSISY